MWMGHWQADRARKGRGIRAATISIKAFYGMGAVAKLRYKIHFRRSAPLPLPLAAHFPLQLASLPPLTAGVHKFGNKFSISPFPSLPSQSSGRISNWGNHSSKILRAPHYFESASKTVNGV